MLKNNTIQQEHLDSIPEPFVPENPMGKPHNIFVGPNQCVAAYDEDGYLIGKFRTVREAAEFFDLTPQTVYNRLKRPNTRKSTFKFAGFFKIVPFEDSIQSSFEPSESDKPVVPDEDAFEDQY